MPLCGQNIVPVDDYILLPAAVGGRFLVHDLRPIVGCFGPRGIRWSRDKQLVPLRQERFMIIIRHQDRTATDGYYSKVVNRQIITAADGATSTTLWDQTVPPDGFSTPHYHEVEETITVLAGDLEITLADRTVRVQAETTYLIPAGVVHSARPIGPHPVRLLTFFPTATPRTLYVDGPPAPVAQLGEPTRSEGA